MNSIRARLAPSPTGNLHVGTAHTGLFNYLFAKHNQGTFILRIDDSDPIRSQKKFETNIIESLKWLGIKWDEGPDIGGDYGPYKQSERKSHYKKYLDQLLKENKAYYCFCTPEELEAERKSQESQKIASKYSGKCKNLSETEQSKFLNEGRKPAIRFRTPDRIITFTDLIRGNVSVDSKVLGDFIIARRDGSALLNIAATVDDIEMKITHAIRGEDFLNLVPRQVLLFEALNYPTPVFAHLSFLYAPDKTKLSKRHGATSVTEYKEMGILKEAMINYLATLGWAVPENIIQDHKKRGVPEELLSFEEIVKLFKLEDVKSSAPIFDIEKLKWLNGVYIRLLSNNDLVKQIIEFAPSIDHELITKLVPFAKERIKTLLEFVHYAEPFIKFHKFAILNDDKKIVELFCHELKNLDEWTTDNLHKLSEEIVNKNNLKLRTAFMVLRLAVTGEKVGLPLFETLEILGKDEVIKRLKQNITAYENK